MTAPKFDGAPRPMKMGTTRSPWRYDAIADYALQPTNLRWPAIFRYVSWPQSSEFRRVVRLPFDSGPLDQSRDRRDGHSNGRSAPLIKKRRSALRLSCLRLPYCLPPAMYVIGAPVALEGSATKTQIFRSRRIGRALGEDPRSRRQHVIRVEFLLRFRKPSPQRGPKVSRPFFRRHHSRVGAVTFSSHRSHFGK